jgi:hypothetical protein
MKFLKGMAPGTRAAIFTLSSRLRMVQGFTADSSALLTALNDPKFGDIITKPSESHTLEDKQNNIDDIQRLLDLTGGRMTVAIQTVMDFQREMTNIKSGERVGMTLEALQYLARYLSATPGRKNPVVFQ